MSSHSIVAGREQLVFRSRRQGAPELAYWGPQRTEAQDDNTLLDRPAPHGMLDDGERLVRD